ncbi:MATE family efflux transporter [Methanobrevibacter sp. AbM4]|uniref:MATE family efflux transporter n=1 Tax=Methanobrevibacter sp. AbM4 TaxID=224719 RepID=UPI0003348264|nr:MATE family efflux transporter [Methanobrevibacter sp. AbM4]AGN16735.1 MATE efflux family protein [Methanobrevibacter sp. AbM4]
MDVNQSNENVNLIKGNPKEAIRRTAPPIIISLFVMSLYNIVDRIWVAGLGTDPLAALGFVEPLFMIIIGLGDGLGAGANSVISRFIGSNDYDEASNSSLHATLIVLIISIIFPLIFIPFLRQILSLMGASDVMNYAMDYILVIFIFTIAFLFNCLFSFQLRAEGDAKRSTVIMVSGGLINIILDPIFIYILNLGIAGSAYATVISNIIPDLLAIYWIYLSKSTYIDYSIKKFKFKWSLIKNLLFVGLPASIEELIMAVVNIVLNGMLSIIAGTAVIASFTSAFSIIEIGMMPGIGVGNAAITIAGVAYSAGSYKKLKTTCHYSIKLSLLISSITFAIIYIFAPQIAHLFSYSASNGSLNVLVTECLRDLSFFVIVAAIGGVCGNVLQGMGKGITSLGLTIIRELILVLLFSFLFCFILSWGIKGVYYGMSIGALIGSLIEFLVFELYLKRFKEEKLN